MLLVLPALRQAPSIDAIRQSAARAIGTSRAGGAWRITGLANEGGLWQRFETVTDGVFRFRRSVLGPLPLVEGFDGRTAWTLGVSGVPHVETRSDRELSRIVEAVVDGGWALAGAPLRFRRLPDEAGEIALEVAAEDGIAPATLRLDPKTFLPMGLTYWGVGGLDEWSFGGYRSLAGVVLATRIEHRGGGDNERIVVQSVSSLRAGRASFAEPAPEARTASFDRQAPREIEVKRVGGYLFVKPRVDGQDVGWFFFDTGADSMVLDPVVAKRLDEPEIGRQATGGVVGTTEIPVSQGTSFGLGPLTIVHPTYLEIDLSDLAKAFGLPIVGICGYDAIGRAAFDIDPKRDRIEVDEPGKAPLPGGAAWTPIDFEGNVPSLACRFEGGRTGVFKLDTGSGSAVDFCAPAVTKDGLLKDRPVTSAQTGGVGGNAESRVGKIAWFELAGRRFDRVPAGFQLTQKGVFASPFFDGNVGMGLLGTGRLILDYGRSRLAFFKS